MSSSSTGSKGDPDAKIQLPSVHSNACSAVHSAFVVGLDNGKIIGRSTWLAISRTISSVNRPPTAVTPTNIVGLYFLITSSRESSLSLSRANGFCSGVSFLILSLPSRLLKYGKGNQDRGHIIRKQSGRHSLPCKNPITTNYHLIVSIDTWCQPAELTHVGPIQRKHLSLFLRYSPEPSLLASTQ